MQKEKPFSTSFPNYVPSIEELRSKALADYDVAKIKFRSCLFLGIIIWPLWILAIFQFSKMKDLENKARLAGALDEWDKNVF